MISANLRTTIPKFVIVAVTLNTQTLDLSNTNTLFIPIVTPSGVAYCGSSVILHNIPNGIRPLPTT